MHHRQLLSATGSQIAAAAIVDEEEEFYVLDIESTGIAGFA
jgi:hypothetical protein